MDARSLKPVPWMGLCLDDLKQFPDDVQYVMGVALRAAQRGGKHGDAKPLRGDPAFRGGDVLEVSDDFDGNTYRLVYTIRFPAAVYAVHAFQKKATQGIATPRREIATIKARLHAATRDAQGRGS
jgi:phage-related protein